MNKGIDSSSDRPIVTFNMARSEITTGLREIANNIVIQLIFSIFKQLTTDIKNEMKSAKKLHVLQKKEGLLLKARAAIAQNVLDLLGKYGSDAGGIPPSMFQPRADSDDG